MPEFFHKIESNGSTIFIIRHNQFVAIDSSNGNIIALPSSITTTLDQTCTIINQDQLPQGPIRNIAISPDNEKFALISETPKQLCSFNMNDFSRLFITETLKRGNAISFTPDSSSILISDKFGDVYKINSPSNVKLMLGHISMILTHIVSPCGGYLITAERDEKIRVSRYPNTYEIVTFCLGHGEYVSSLCMHDGYLVSGGGDGFLCVWDWLNGVELSRFDLTKFIPDEVRNRDVYTTVRAIKSFGEFVAVVLEGVPEILILTLSSNTLALSQRVALAHAPLDISFDSTGNLWMVYAAYDRYLDVSRLIDGKYAEPKQDDKLVDAVNRLDGLQLQDKEEGIDVYEIGKLGKMCVSNKGKKWKRDSEGKCVFLEFDEEPKKRRKQQ